MWFRILNVINAFVRIILLSVRKDGEGIELVDGAKAAYLPYFARGTIGHACPALVLPERLVNGEKRGWGCGNLAA